MREEREEKEREEREALQERGDEPTEPFGKGGRGVPTDPTGPLDWLRADSGRALRTIASYCPQAVSLPVMLGARSPFGNEFDGVVLISDVSGFTNLAERLAMSEEAAAEAAEKEGGAADQRRGADATASVINRIFSRLISIVRGHGGDVIKFAGDALLSLWRPAGGGQPAAGESLHACSLHAVRAALEMSELMGGMASPVRDAPIDLHSAVCAGRLLELRIGGYRARWEYVICGAPVEELGRCLAAAAHGEVVVGERVGRVLAGDKALRVEPRGARWLLVSRAPGASAGATAAAAPPADLVRELVHCASESDRSRLAGRLCQYVPSPVMSALSAGAGGMLAELRKNISTLFVNLPDFLFSSPEEIRASQHAFEMVQRVLARHEGVLRQFIQDDKGTVAIVAFGLPYSSHEDDATRAVLAAIAVRGALLGRRMRCGIGVTTGPAYCGSVGSEVRCEYAVVGSCVNLSARLMGCAGDNVLCDEETKNRVQQGRQATGVYFRPMEAVLSKGRGQSVATFRPVPLGQSHAIGAPATPMFGRAAETAAVREALSRPSCPVVVVEGDAGMGKTRLVQEAAHIARGAGVRCLYGVGASVSGGVAYSAWANVVRPLLQDGAGEKAAQRLRRSDQVLLRSIAFPASSAGGGGVGEGGPAAGEEGGVGGGGGGGDGGAGDDGARDGVLERLPTLPKAVLCGERARRTAKVVLHLVRAALADGPILLVIENAQWLDSLSWQLLVASAAAGLAGLRVMVTLRTGSPSLFPRAAESAGFRRRRSRRSRSALPDGGGRGADGGVDADRDDSESGSTGSRSVSRSRSRGAVAATPVGRRASSGKGLAADGAPRAAAAAAGRRPRVPFGALPPSRPGEMASLFSRLRPRTARRHARRSRGTAAREGGEQEEQEEKNGHGGEVEVEEKEEEEEEEEKKEKKKKEQDGAGSDGSSRSRPTVECVRIVLSPLELPHVQALCAHRLGVVEDELPRNLASLVAEKSDGNPLYAEEIFSVLATSGAPLHSQRLARVIREMRLASIEKIILGRVDRLDPTAKEVLNLASVVGVHFSPRLVPLVLPYSEATVRSSLGMLEDAGFILFDPASDAATAMAAGVPAGGWATARGGGGGGGGCGKDAADGRIARFRHAAMRDVVYGDLYWRQRAAFHGRVAACIEEHQLDVLCRAHADGPAVAVASVLARHFEAAGQPLRAVFYWHMAADVASRLNATLEAIEYYLRVVRIAGSGGRSGLVSAVSVASWERRIAEQLMLAGQGSSAGVHAHLESALHALGHGVPSAAPSLNHLRAESAAALARIAWRHALGRGRVALGSNGGGGVVGSDVRGSGRSGSGGGSGGSGGGGGDGGGAVAAKDSGTTLFRRARALETVHVYRVMHDNAALHNDALVALYAASAAAHSAMGPASSAALRAASVSTLALACVASGRVAMAVRFREASAAYLAEAESAPPPDAVPDGEVRRSQAGAALALTRDRMSAVDVALGRWRGLVRAVGSAADAHLRVRDSFGVLRGTVTLALAMRMRGALAVSGANFARAFSFAAAHGFRTFALAAAAGLAENACLAEGGGAAAFHMAEAWCVLPGGAHGGGDGPEAASHFGYPSAEARARACAAYAAWRENRHGDALDGARGAAVLLAELAPSPDLLAAHELLLSVLCEAAVVARRDTAVGTSATRAACAAAGRALEALQRLARSVPVAVPAATLWRAVCRLATSCRLPASGNAAASDASPLGSFAASWPVPDRRCAALLRRALDSARAVGLVRTEILAHCFLALCGRRSSGPRVLLPRSWRRRAPLALAGIVDAGVSVEAPPLPRHAGDPDELDTLEDRIRDSCARARAGVGGGDAGGVGLAERGTRERSEAHWREASCLAAACGLELAHPVPVPEAGGAEGAAAISAALASIRGASSSSAAAAAPSQLGRQSSGLASSVSRNAATGGGGVLSAGPESGDSDGGDADGGFASPSAPATKLPVKRSRSLVPGADGGADRADAEAALVRAVSAPPAAPGESTFLLMLNRDSRHGLAGSGTAAAAGRFAPDKAAASGRNILSGVSVSLSSLAGDVGFDGEVLLGADPMGGGGDEGGRGGGAGGGANEAASAPAPPAEDVRSPPEAAEDMRPFLAAALRGFADDDDDDTQPAAAAASAAAEEDEELAACVDLLPKRVLLRLLLRAGDGSLPARRAHRAGRGCGLGLSADLFEGAVLYVVVSTPPLSPEKRAEALAPWLVSAALGRVLECLRQGNGRLGAVCGGSVLGVWESSVGEGMRRACVLARACASRVRRALRAPFAKTDGGEASALPLAGVRLVVAVGALVGATCPLASADPPPASGAALSYLVGGPAAAEAVAAAHSYAAPSSSATGSSRRLSVIMTPAAARAMPSGGTAGGRPASPTTRAGARAAAVGPAAGAGSDGSGGSDDGGHPGREKVFERSTTVDLGIQLRSRRAANGGEATAGPAPASAAALAPADDAADLSNRALLDRVGRFVDRDSLWRVLARYHAGLPAAAAPGETRQLAIVRFQFARPAPPRQTAPPYEAAGGAAPSVRSAGAGLSEERPRTRPPRPADMGADTPVWRSLGAIAAELQAAAAACGPGSFAAVTPRGGVLEGCLYAASAEEALRAALVVTASLAACGVRCAAGMSHGEVSFRALGGPFGRQRVACGPAADAAAAALAAAVAAVAASPGDAPASWQATAGSLGEPPSPTFGRILARSSSAKLAAGSERSPRHGRVGAGGPTEPSLGTARGDPSFFLVVDEAARRSLAAAGACQTVPLPRADQASEAEGDGSRRSGSPLPPRRPLVPATAPPAPMRRLAAPSQAAHDSLPSPSAAATGRSPAFHVVARVAARRGADAAEDGGALPPAAVGAVAAAFTGHAPLEALVSRVPHAGGVAVAEAKNPRREGRHGKFIIVCGEDGSGRRELVVRFASLAAARDRELAVFATTASELKRTAPWYVVRDLVARLLPVRAASERRAAAAAVSAFFARAHEDLAPFLPLLNTVAPFSFPRSRETEGLTPAARVGMTVRVTLALLARVLGAGSRVVFVVHGAQWVDAPSWELLARVPHVLPHVTCVVTTSVRDTPSACGSVGAGEPAGGAPRPGRFYTALRRAKVSYDTVPVGNLSLAQCRAVALAHLGMHGPGAGLVRVLHRTSEGKASYLRKLLSLLVRDGHLTDPATGERIANPASSDAGSVLSASRDGHGGSGDAAEAAWSDAPAADRLRAALARAEGVAAPAAAAIGGGLASAAAAATAAAPPPSEILTIESATRAVLRHVSEEERMFMGAASVFGRRFRLDMMARVHPWRFSGAEWSAEEASAACARAASSLINHGILVDVTVQSSRGTESDTTTTGSLGSAESPEPSLPRSASLAGGVGGAGGGGGGGDGGPAAGDVAGSGGSAGVWKAPRPSTVYLAFLSDAYLDAASDSMGHAVKRAAHRRVAEFYTAQIRAAGKLAALESALLARAAAVAARRPAGPASVPSLIRSYSPPREEVVAGAVAGPVAAALPQGLNALPMAARRPPVVAAAAPPPALPSAARTGGGGPVRAPAGAPSSGAGSVPADAPFRDGGGTDRPAAPDRVMQVLEDDAARVRALLAVDEDDLPDIHVLSYHWRQAEATLETALHTLMAAEESRLNHATHEAIVLYDEVRRLHRLLMSMPADSPERVSAEHHPLLQLETVLFDQARALADVGMLARSNENVAAVVHSLRRKSKCSDAAVRAAAPLRFRRAAAAAAAAAEAGGNTQAQHGPPAWAGAPWASPPPQAGAHWGGGPAGVALPSRQRRPRAADNRSKFRVWLPPSGLRAPERDEELRYRLDRVNRRAQGLDANQLLEMRLRARDMTIRAGTRPPAPALHRCPVHSALPRPHWERDRMRHMRRQLFSGQKPLSASLLGGGGGGAGNNGNGSGSPVDADARPVMSHALLLADMDDNYPVCGLSAAEVERTWTFCACRVLCLYASNCMRSGSLAAALHAALQAAELALDYSLAGMLGRALPLLSALSAAAGFGLEAAALMSEAVLLVRSLPDAGSHTRALVAKHRALHLVGQGSWRVAAHLLDVTIAENGRGWFAGASAEAVTAQDRAESLRDQPRRDMALAMATVELLRGRLAAAAEALSELRWAARRHDDMDVELRCAQLQGLVCLAAGDAVEAMRHAAAAAEIEDADRRPRALLTAVVAATGSLRLGGPRRPFAAAGHGETLERVFARVTGRGDGAYLWHEAVDLAACAEYLAERLCRLQSASGKHAGSSGRLVLGYEAGPRALALPPRPRARPRWRARPTALKYGIRSSHKGRRRHPRPPRRRPRSSGRRRGGGGSGAPSADASDSDGGDGSSGGGSGGSGGSSDDEGSHFGDGSSSSGGKVVARAGGRMSRSSRGTDGGGGSSPSASSSSDETGTSERHSARRERRRRQRASGSDRDGASSPSRGSNLTSSAPDSPVTSPSGGRGGGGGGGGGSGGDGLVGGGSSTYLVLPDGSFAGGVADTRRRLRVVVRRLGHVSARFSFVRVMWCLARGCLMAHDRRLTDAFALWAEARRRALDMPDPMALHAAVAELYQGAYLPVADPRRHGLLASSRQRSEACGASHYAALASRAMLNLSFFDLGPAVRPHVPPLHPLGPALTSAVGAHREEPDPEASAAAGAPHLVPTASIHVAASVRGAGLADAAPRLW